MTNKIKLIGIAAEGRASILPIYEAWINESEVLVGGKRQLGYFPDYNGEKIEIKGRLNDLIESLKNEKRPTVILASGDPYFYGIGTRLAGELPLEVYPNVSSIQLAFAKMNTAWHDAYFTSVHGRSMVGLAQRINGKKKIVILTDHNHSPSRIASYLLSFGMSEYQAFVAEDIGGEHEHFQWYSLNELAITECHSLNVLFLIQTAPSPYWTVGIEDEEFSQRKPEAGLITKKEIRVLSLSAMKITEKSIVWDIGTCTGAMAIEAAKIAREGAIFAIEKNAADLENCYKNLAKFRTDITVLKARAPEGLDQFPDPDAVFIGGTSGNMEEILTVCCTRLKEDGRIVVNAATIESLSDAVAIFRSKGFETTITLAQISRSKPVLHLTRFDPLNPIYIITGSRMKGEVT
ncbi:precorrin-6y C5,15-methyltransferase (decarboxylating) subunit CbiE [Robertmurraya sp. P23]|uniref:precorrin-6y C5,15-methyltransferase (decarboxylating) subunit CbiE n=1 Tax=Robertmurraya sp. P23 TaxID=3436931 RepID=UPI003D9992DE